MMIDYKKSYLIMWNNYKHICNSVVRQYFKASSDVIEVTMGTGQTVTYRSYCFVGKHPKFFNSSGNMTKGYPVDLCVAQKTLVFTYRKFFCLKWNTECCMHANNQDRSPRKISR